MFGGGVENDIAISSSFHHSVMCRLNGCVFGQRHEIWGFFVRVCKNEMFLTFTRDSRFLLLEECRCPQSVYLRVMASFVPSVVKNI